MRWRRPRGAAHRTSAGRGRPAPEEDPERAPADAGSIGPGCGTEPPLRALSPSRKRVAEAARGSDSSPGATGPGPPHQSPDRTCRYPEVPLAPFPGHVRMDPSRDSNLWALANACQRLSDRVRQLATDRGPVGAAPVEELARLVQRATDLLEKGTSAVAPALSSGARKRRGGLFSFVLGAEEDPAPSTGGPTSPRAPSPAHTLALQGHDELIPTPDLVDFLSSHRKTGLLEVATVMELFTLEFNDGDIVHAHSNRTPEGQRLGDILVARSMIGRDVLEQSLRVAGSGRLGETLVAQKWITQEQFVEVLRLQIHGLFQRLFEQPASHFRFWSGPPLHADANVRLNATALLLDGARAFDETRSTTRTPAEGAERPALPAAPVPEGTVASTDPGGAADAA